MYAWVQSPPQCMVSSRTQLYPQQSAFSLITVNYSVIPNARKHQKFCRKNLVQNPSIYIAVHHVRTYLKDTLNLQSLTHTCPRKFSATYQQPRKKADPPIPIISRNVDYNVDTCCKFSLEANLRTAFYVYKIPHVVVHLAMYASSKTFSPMESGGHQHSQYNAHTMCTSPQFSHLSPM